MSNADIAVYARPRTKFSDLESMGHAVDKFLESMPKVLPIVASGALGGVIGWYAHSGETPQDTAFGITRLSLESMLFTYCMSIENAAATNVFGAAGMTSILAMVPIASAKRWYDEQIALGKTASEMQADNPAFFQIMDKILKATGQPFGALGQFILESYEMLWTLLTQGQSSIPAK